MDLGNDCQLLLTSQNKGQPDVMYLLREVYNTTYETTLQQFKPETGQAKSCLIQSHSHERSSQLKMGWEDDGNEDALVSVRIIYKSSAP